MRHLYAVGNFGDGKFYGILYEGAAPVVGEVFTADRSKSAGLGIGSISLFETESFSRKCEGNDEDGMPHKSPPYWYIVLSAVIDSADEEFMRGISS